jgi:hypothetical protein
MGFASGSVSFHRFAVGGKAPERSAALDLLRNNAFEAAEESLPEEVEYGWCGGRHVFDAQFSHEHNAFADCLYFGLRIDTNKVPADVVKAWTIMEETALAAANPSGFISKAQKKAVKESIRAREEAEIRTGKHRRSKVTPVLWDVDRGILYSPAGGGKFEKLAELFYRTFALDLQPMTSGMEAIKALTGTKTHRGYDDLRPTQFVVGPEGESAQPDYPWIARGAQPANFLGNEFLTWLVHEADARTAMINTGGGSVTVFFDKSIDFECVYGQTGKDTLRGDGPTRSPEAREAFRTGKVPRKAGVVLDVNRQQFSLTLHGETLSIGTASLPNVEEADTARTLFEARIGLVRDLGDVIDRLFAEFLKLRSSDRWEAYVAQVRKWILSPTKKAAA